MVLGIGYAGRSTVGEPGDGWWLHRQSSKQNNCLSCHEKNSDETVGLFAHSTHSRRGISCKDCHGGNESAVDKPVAHSQDFIGKMNSNQILQRCGSCHQSPLESFKTSRHFPERKNLARVDCVQCHGAHTVGISTGGSSFEYVCAGCHGLEYLPELPAALRKTLAMTDEVRDLWHAAESNGRKPSEESLKLRRELRRLLGEWVHTTDAQTVEKRADEFFAKSNRLRELLSERQK
jgi:hypothetical protein